MSIFFHEMRRGRTALIIWTAAIAFMLLVCMLMFPEMKTQVGSIDEMFSSMGSFTEAFGMDKVSYSDALGFYAIECGNVLGIGGGFFAALIGIGALCSEEKNHTAEFLLTHPVSRVNVITQKLMSVFARITIMNIIVVIVSALSFVMIDEKIKTKEFLLLHLAFFILQLEIAAICFAISSFIRSSGIGIGLGLAALLYFVNIIANLSENVKFLKYITPFGYAEAADIVSDSKINACYLSIGIAVTIITVVLAYVKYNKKDIA